MYAHTGIRINVTNIRETDSDIIYKSYIIAINVLFIYWLVK